MRGLAAAIPAFVGLLAFGGAATACDLTPTVAGTRTLAAGRYVLAFRTEPAIIAAGQPFEIEFRVCPVAGAAIPERLVVDATMPEHRHGMNYAPSVMARGGGRYRAEGLMLHMPGHWELAFEIKAGGATQLLTFDIQVP